MSEQDGTSKTHETTMSDQDGTDKTYKPVMISHASAFL